MLVVHQLEEANFLHHSYRSRWSCHRLSADLNLEQLILMEKRDHLPAGWRELVLVLQQLVLALVMLRLELELELEQQLVEQVQRHQRLE